MIQSLEQHAEKGNQFLNLLVNELGEYSDKEVAARILRAVFRALRKHLTLEENFHLLSQLPIAIKGIYVDGWSPTKHTEKVSHKLEDFYSEVVKEEGVLAWKDFSNEDEIAHAIRAVINVLRNYVSEGQMNDIKAVLPRELKILFSTSNNVS